MAVAPRGGERGRLGPGGHLGAGWLALHGELAFGAAWQAWFVAHTLGLVLFTPFLLGWSEPELRRSLVGRVRREAILLSGLTAALSWLVFNGDHPIALFLPFPLVLLLAVRTGLLGASIGAGTLAVTAMWLSLGGDGPIALMGDTARRIEIVQLYAIIALLISIPIAVLQNQRDRTETRLRAAEAGSEKARREAEHARDEAQRSLQRLAAVQEEQARSAARLRSALRAGNMGTWEVDLQKQESVWSDLAYTFLGYAVGEVPPGREALLAQVHPEDRPRVEKVVNAPIGHRDPFRHEFRVVHPDGTVVWCEDYADLSCDAAGRPLRFVGIVRNITERKLAEAALQASEARYRLIAENSMDMVVQADVSGRNLYVSPRSRDLLGYNPEDLIGTRLSDLVHPDDFPDLDLKLCDLKRGNVRTAVSTFRLRRSDETWLTVEATYRTALSPDGEPQEVIGAIRDISERERLEEQLRQAHKMEAVGQLTGGIAHDFNNLLTIIMANAEFLAEDADDVASVHSLSRLILDAAEHGAELTDELLVFARRQPLKPKRLMLEEAVESVVPLLRRTLADNIELAARPSLSRSRIDPKT